MVIPKPSSEDLDTFRDLFIGPRNVAVVSGKQIVGYKTDDHFTDDLLLQHFSGEVSVAAAMVTPGPRIHPSEGEGTANQFAISFRPPDPAVVKALLAELAGGFGIKAYVEYDLRSRCIVRGFFLAEGNGHTFTAMPAWYAAERVRLRLAPTTNFLIRPEFPPDRKSNHYKAFGGFLELPFAPRGGRFVDPDTMVPYADQWKFLRSVVRNPVKVLWDARDVVMRAWATRKDFDVLGRPIHKGPRPLTPRSPYEGLMFAELRAGHDAIYFAPWRRPEATPIDIRRAEHLIRRLLGAVSQALKGKDLPARCDIDQVIDTLSNNFPGEDSLELVVLMDKALTYVHRAIDTLLEEKGLPPHNSMDFATAIPTA